MWLNGKRERKHTVQISKIGNGNATNSIDVPAAHAFLTFVMLQAIQMRSFFAEEDSGFCCLGVQNIPALSGTPNAFFERT